jgi:hypothetical protein
MTYEVVDRLAFASEPAAAVRHETLALRASY